MSIIQSLLYSCEAEGCREQHRKDVRLPIETNAMTIQTCPQGWSQVGGRIYCAQHDIVIDPLEHGWKRKREK